MDDEHDIISAWIAREIVPHERSVRSWLSRRWHHVVDVEDVVQEAYCRIANLASVDHIENARSYFFRTAHTVVTDLMRRAGIINFNALTQIDWSNVMDGAPLADRVLEASQELERVNRLLSQLPDTYRRAIELRRIEGLSRRETAERLGVSEDALKKHVERGMHQVIKAMAEQDARIDGDERGVVEQKVEVIGKHRPH
ncbi:MULTISPECIES: RNA polymerase sigma factor [unclassified Sphingomonas]|uniref:RNA polymerase sigma factor n=1 Tax=unclassified Sphingomonas TaxID=196159 RepID=UPI0006F87D7A|nr:MULTISPECIES: sigma-70 family RNA polymerase sigma factor [unclassified Sphingomonas]KQX21699.1 hypothetical protein ASD17_07075 [Sphingomonas sp. Root1294]KQY73014.1 hypothetical protein ASD39_01060 [Sphingomonas sp. Root50]KRB88188.1 hypothetical protein ASE22_22375 [Sphingomonas sp. Root720]